MSEGFELEIVDGRSLPDEYRAALHPGEVLCDETGARHRLPRYFYRIDSWNMAKTTILAPNFGLYEFISTDLREARPLHTFPRFVPLAILHTAAQLALLRRHLDTYVHIAANGGYRSPAHELARNATPHLWGTAVNIFRIGDDLLDSGEQIERYKEIVEKLLPGAWVRPYGSEVGATIDHLHVDFGRFVVSPREKDTCIDGSGGPGEHEASG